MHLFQRSGLTSFAIRPCSVALLFGIVFLAACSRSELPAPATATAQAGAGPGATPAPGMSAGAAGMAGAPGTTSTAATTAAAIPPSAILRNVPPEDQLEPVGIDQARLPGGAALPGNPAEPAPARRKAAP